MDAIQAAPGRGRPCFWGVKSRLAYNGPRVYEPARRAQAVALLTLSNRRDRRAGWAKARRAFAVNPLLGDL